MSKEETTTRIVTAEYSRLIYMNWCGRFAVKYVQVIAKPDIEEATQLLRLLTDSVAVTEAKLSDWTLSGTQRPTLLFEVLGDRDAFRDRLGTIPAVKWSDTTRIDEGRFNALLLLESDPSVLLRDVFGALTREQLIAAKPVVYRDRQIHAHIVGNEATLQTTIEEMPADVALDIVKFGEFDRRRDAPMSALSERQRTALLTAFDLGYYEQPRQATHEDVAERIGCAPNTASEHLQKAESTIIEAVLEASRAPSA